MDVSELFSLIPDKLLEELAIETEVNKYSKKLQGELIFKLLIYCIVSHKSNSLRTMESAYESITFQMLNQGSRSNTGVKFNSISERLSVINATYFERLYNECVAIYGSIAGESASAIVRFDSTIVSLSSQILHIGYQLKGGDAAHLRQLKFTIGLSEIPTSAKLFVEQKYTSENTALREAIESHLPSKSDAIRIFDRGITSRKTHDDLSAKKIPFISRINPNSKHEVLQQNTISNPSESPTLNIVSDEWIYLFTTDKGRAKYPIRCIRAKTKSNDEPLAFITNIPDIDAVAVTALYRRRWDIEVFFKFLKQELNFSHLINRSENGIKVMLYATMIAAILLLTYKKKNKLSGFKIMKLKFTQELEKFIVRDIVFICNGDLKLFDKLFKNPPS